MPFKKPFKKPFGDRKETVREDVSERGVPSGTLRKQSTDRSSSRQKTYSKPDQNKQTYGKAERRSPAYGITDERVPPHERPDQRQQPYGKQGQSKQAYGKPDQSKQAYGKPDQSKQAYGKPDQGKQPYGKPDQGKQPYGRSDQGKQPYDRPDQRTQAHVKMEQRNISHDKPAERSQRIDAAYRQADMVATKRAPRSPLPKTTPPPAPRRPEETHWGDVALWYDKHVGDEGSEYHREVILPGVLRLLNLDKITSGKPRLLDIACGQGVLCRALAKEGCQVVGIDAAAELIAAAKRRNSGDNLSIDYRVADATKLIEGIGKTADGLRPGSFDAVTIVLSIQNMTPLSPVWHAVWSLLKPKGTLVIVMMHPCFRIPRHSDWMWHEKSLQQQRVVSQYLSSAEVSIVTHPGDAARGLGSSTTTHFHRPLQAYINTLGNAGLFVDRLDEWTSHKVDQAGPKKAAMDKAREEIPLFLALRARKM